MDIESKPAFVLGEKSSDPFAALDGRRTSIVSHKGVHKIEAVVANLHDADEALAFLENHPERERIAAEGQAILDDPIRLKKLVRKIDLLLVPILFSVYFLQFLDKTTLGYTAVMGLRTDLKLKGQEYSDLSMLFYIGFIVAEFPTQYLAQHFSKLGTYLGANIVIWGLVLGTSAACHDFAGLAVVRVLLGVFESCVAPILIIIIAMWYKKEEQGRRVSWFYCCNSITQIIGGLIAYGVTSLHTKFATWRVFYLAIGAATMVAGLAVMYFLPNSPVTARQFTDSEKVAVLLRIKSNQSGTHNSHLKKDQVLEALKDGRVWLVALCVMLGSIPNGGISNFSSILLTTFGYTSRQALILGVPSGAIGAFFVLLSGWLSDRWKDRSTVMLICLTPTIIAAAMMIGLDPGGHPKSKPALLFASFLVSSFGASFMLLLAWSASNIAGATKKVTVNAIILIAFCVGNIIGTQTFRTNEAPGYISGKISILVCLAVLCVAVFGLRFYNDYLNKQNERKRAGMSEEEQDLLRDKMAFADQTDRSNIFFVYTH